MQSDALLGIQLEHWFLENDFLHPDRLGLGYRLLPRIYQVICWVRRYTVKLRETLWGRHPNWNKEPISRRYKQP